MAERLRVTAATLAEIIEAEFTKSLGRSAADYMPRVHIRASKGQPNWHVTVGVIVWPILGAFNEAMGRVQTAYDLDAPSYRHLLSLSSA